MKKRLFSILLTLCMVLSFAPTAVLAEGGADTLASGHSHCICGGENTVGDHTAHQAADYQPWNGSDAISYTDGKAYVYLTDNATINSNLVVDGATLYLCLNGKEYASNGTNKIQVKNSGHLVLCDCKGTGVIKGATSGWGGMGIYIYTGTVDIFGGKFTGGKVTGKGGGGAIALEDSSSTLNIYGGEMSGNNGNNHGGAIYTKNGGTINMYGGRIAKNEAYRGGGLRLTGGSTFNMYGGLLENNSSTARWDTIPANSGNLYIADGAVMNANAGVVRGGGYAAVFNLGTIQTDDANYPATKFYSGLYNMGGVAKGGMYYGSYMAAGGNMGDCYVYYALEESWGAQARFARQFIEPGNLPTRPDDPAKAGYIFEGWRNVDGTPFDFSKPVQESMMAVAIWSECNHAGSTAQPTCTDSAVCTMCGGTIPATGHTIVWHSENGQYWQTCSNCSFVSEKKAVPEVILNAPNTVCRTQDCAFTFNLPEGCTNPEYGYEFVSVGGGDSATVENGVCSGVIEAEWYASDETSFVLTVYVTTADGFTVTASKTVKIAEEHVYEWQSANSEYWQKCTRCGSETAKKAVPEIVISGPDTVCRTQDCAFTFNLPEGCTNPEYGYEFVSVGGGDSATVENGVCSGVIEAEWYASDETSFVLTVYVTTADGFTVTASKTVKIAEEHVYEWQSANSEYWQKCTRCGSETAKKAIPEIVISGPDTVCRTQDGVFRFTLPEGCSLVTAGYEFDRIGGDLPTAPENGAYTVALAASAYPAEENGYRITVCVKTADGFTVRVEKTVTIQNEHTGGTATCTDKAKCTVCGAEYGEPDPENHSDLQYFPAKAATKTAEGNIAYWYCSACGKYFADEDGTKEITKADTVTEKLKDTKTPQTGDAINLTLWVTLLLVSGSAAAAAVICGKKKQHR